MRSLRCATFNDELNIVDVESTFIRGLPSFNIVGLPSQSIKESENRIKAALLNRGFSFPPKKIIINLSPSDLPKKGSHFDLSIALLIFLQQEEIDSEFFVFGELGLDGLVKSTATLFSHLLFLSSKVKSAKVLVPNEIANRAASIPNLEIYTVSNLDDAIQFFRDEEFKKSCYFAKKHKIFENVIEIDGEIYVPNYNYPLDFISVRGQKRAKRASLIAASGMHNLLFEGSPGSGKSMCAKRIRYILPPQSLDEILLASAYESLDNKDSDFSAFRPFRSPHHTSTRGSIFGGGSQNARVGEVALANGGELFFDELPHFPKKILESLREPLEDNRILISRVNSKICYETKFIFVAAMNPCPCGFLYSKNSDCICSANEIKRYKNAISGPLLDRIDLYVAMDEIDKNDTSDVSSKELYKLVLKAFYAQKQRGQKELNAKLSDDDVERFCKTSSLAKELLNSAISRFALTQRGINKSLKVARTISDLRGEKEISKEAMIEALSFRVRE